MKDSVKMNSPELQKNFHTTYKNFFNVHDIVLSGDTVLTWWADISQGISALRIKQKLPIKAFCWANLNDSGKVSFRTVFHYSALENTFEEEEFALLFKRDTESISWFLQDFLVENGFQWGLEIDFLTETPRWHGFAFSWVVSVLLTFLVYVAIGKLDTKTIIDRELPTDHPLFEELYNFSLRLSYCISHGKSTGSSNYAIMLPNTPLPIVYLQKNTVSGVRGEHTTDHPDADALCSTDAVIYKNTLMNFLWIDSTTIPEIPLDYAVLFTGMEYTFSEIESTREREKKENDRLDAFIGHAIESLPIGEEARDTLSHLLCFDKNETFHKSIDKTDMRVLEAFDYLFRNNYNDSAINAFINTIKSIGLTSFSYQKENKLFFALEYFFYQYRQFEDEEIGILPFNTGKIGGSLFFVMKSAKSRATIQKVLDMLRYDGHIVHLDYASWRDGYSSSGVRLEQCITQGAYSDYTKEGNILFTDTFGTSYFGDYDTVIKNEKDCILLDTIGGRIYIQGTKLTSKDIHSQNTTIDMMTLLLENIGEEVSNLRLPVSTYSQNKNEILSKIVLPLRKLTKEYFWKEISLVCSGGITSYYFRLERDEWIRVGIIKKLWN